MGERSLPHYFYDDAFVALSVELRVEHTLPRPKIEAPGGNRQDYLMMNQ